MRGCWVLGAAHYPQVCTSLGIITSMSFTGVHILVDNNIGVVLQVTRTSKERSAGRGPWAAGPAPAPWGW